MPPRLDHKDEACTRRRTCARTCRRPSPPTPLALAVAAVERDLDADPGLDLDPPHHLLVGDWPWWPLAARARVLVAAKLAAAGRARP